MNAFARNERTLTTKRRAGAPSPWHCSIGGQDGGVFHYRQAREPPSIASAKTIVSAMNSKPATGHCRNGLSMLSIAMPAPPTARIAPPLHASMSPAGMRGNRCPQRRNPTASNPPIRTGQSADQNSLGANASYSDAPVMREYSAQGKATAQNAIASQGKTRPTDSAAGSSRSELATRRKRK